MILFLLYLLCLPLPLFRTPPAPAPRRNYKQHPYIPAKQSPRHNRAKPQWVRDKVRKLRVHMPTASHAKISDTFNQIHAAQSMTVSKSTVHRWLQADRYLILQMRRELKHRRPYPVAPNAVWGMDMTGKADTKGTIHTILACVDHGTRKCTALEILQNKNSWTLLGHLFLAIGQFGKPRAIRTDNEPCFTSHVFTTVLRLADIKHQRTEPGCPWQNGHIERFFCTLKQKLNMIRPTSKAVLENLLKEFHFWYDAVRPHQHLNGATPQQIWDGINPWSTPVKEERLFIGWEGMLTGFWLRR